MPTNEPSCEPTPLGDARAHVERIFEIVEHIRLFEDFTRDEIERLAAYLQCFRVPAGHVILSEGEPGDHMVLLIEGSVDIVKRDRHGERLRLASAGPGKTLGEMSLIDGEPRFASCIATTPCLYAQLDRTALGRLLVEHPQLGIKLLMELMILLNQRLRAVSSELMRCLDGAHQRPA